MENKKKYGTIPNLQGSQFGNGNKEMETPLDRPRRENGKKQNTNRTHTQQSRRAMNRKTKKVVGRGCRRGFEEDGRQGLAKKNKGGKTNGRTSLRRPRSYKDCSGKRVSGTTKEATTDKQKFV
jgi:FtsZ-interacting cell division protein YlmF